MTARHPFVPWFATRYGQDDTPVGELARHVWLDATFPVEGDRDELRLHLLRVFALVVIPGDFDDVWDALDAFEDAWAEWEPNAAFAGTAHE